MSAGRTPWRREEAHERFARAAESLARDSAPTESEDSRLAGELAVVLMLGRLAEATGPDPAERARMREKVLAELPVAPPESTTSSAPGPDAGRAGRRPPRRATARPAPAGTSPANRTPSSGRVTGTRGRLFIALGAAFCLVVALSGMTLLLSRNALPGDALYGLRRTVEGASLGLSSDEQARGTKHLEFAADRIGDLESLAARYPDVRDSPSGDYLTALADFDSDATAGAFDLTEYGVANGPSALTTLHDWAGQQQARITAVRGRLPAEASTRAGASLALLGRIEQRSTDLLGRLHCYTVTAGPGDELGPQPATGECDQTPGQVSPSVRGTGDTAGNPALPGLPGDTTAVIPTSGNGVPGGSGGGQRLPVAPSDATTFTTQPPVPPLPPGGPTAPPTTTTTAPPGLSLPFPLPLTVPPLLPGLPGIQLGG